MTKKQRISGTFKALLLLASLTSLNSAEDEPDWTFVADGDAEACFADAVAAFVLTEGDDGTVLVELQQPPPPPPALINTTGQDPRLPVQALRGGYQRKKLTYAEAAQLFGPPARGGYGRGGGRGGRGARGRGGPVVRGNFQPIRRDVYHQ